ncbi:anthranilate phosphoribosyltransferase [Actinopolymorpha sp. B9G3]|uniref:anthranilate phosphoribosyltransferase n=1 Tax=Actinopolymorpha sp. B9G3 TaxID=3158970 RepID=UPI0032D921EE
MRPDPTTTTTTMQTRTHEADRASWSRILGTLAHRRDLSTEDAAWAMDQVVRGDVTPAQLGAFLVGLRAKGETADEVSAMARAVMDQAGTLPINGVFVDIVGTGGDRSGVVNVSTMASLVVAATGVPVVKHGGRGASTTCGSADLLEYLGLDLDLEPQRVATLAEKVGITFCFAPSFHPGLRHAAPVRRELGVPTVFNVLAPLLNPARPRHQVVGVADVRMAGVLADVLAARGCSALVVRGDDGVDKLTTTTTSQVWMIRDGRVRRTTVDPADVGLPRATPTDLRGGAVEQNAETVRRLLEGAGGPVRDIVLLNAAAALVAVERGDAALAEQLAAGVERCASAIDSGAAATLLDRWIAASRSAGGPE